MTFPITFPFEFPGPYSPSVELESLEGTGLSWIPSHGDADVALLLDQFQRKPRLVALIRALASEIQDLDDAAWQVLTERGLDNAIGAQLDMIGKVVDLARAGWDDEVYRGHLRAQILVLRSDATWPALLAILDVLEVDVSLSMISEPGPASMLIALGAPTDDDFPAAELFLVIVRAKAAGVRFVIEFPTFDVSESFTWADGDVDQADAARGWADDDDADLMTSGGYWIGDLATTETR